MAVTSPTTRQRVRRRRHRGPGRDRLVERDWELAAIEQSLAAARAESGGAVLIEAPAGLGKSRLLTAAGDTARDADLRILTATGSELERDFPFGLAIQLFEPLWLTSTAQERESLLAGPAQLASKLLTAADAQHAPELDGQEYQVIHGLFSVLQELVWAHREEADGGALAMLVDDVHLADRWSLRFLAYLTERIRELPIALILSVRPGESCVEPMALATVRRAAHGPVLRPSPLSTAGVERIVRSRFPDAEEAFSAACANVTGGNPFLLIALLEELHEDERVPGPVDAEQLAALAPKRVRDRVCERLAAMSDNEREVARTVALFADGATVRQVSRLDELDFQGVVRAADALAAVNLLRPGIPLSFKYPLERSAVAESLSALTRGLGHQRAAAILAEDHAPAAEIAVHLLEAPPEHNPAAIAALREAATEALASGAAPERPIRLLHRALAEGPASDLRVELLAELGHAEAQAGLPQASERLKAARKISDLPKRRAELALAEGHALYAQGRYRDATTVLEAGLAELDEQDQELWRDLTAAYISAASLVDDLQARAVQRREQMIGTLKGEPNAAQRAAIARTLVRDSLLGAPRDTIVRLADLAWSHSALAEVQAADPLSWPLLAAGLLLVDELEQTVEICDAVLAGVSSEAASAPQALVRCCRAWALYEQGRIGEAEAEASAALEAPPDDSRSYASTALAVMACCQIDRGHLELAETTLVTLAKQPIRGSIVYPRLHEVRAQLRLAQHRPREALKDAARAGVILESEFPNTTPGAIPWRSTAALANLALGEPERAQVMAEEELEIARRVGVTRIVIRDLRVLGLARGGKAGLALLAEAVDTGETYPSRLERVRALVDLGAALRRANRRADAREPLRTGLDLSHKGGASVLADRAQTELVATGARPRRPESSGIDSLTVSQLRVAELAARGLTTRQIAEALFVTPKTVEYHLRQTYRKLDIASRGELPEMLKSAPLKTAPPKAGPPSAETLKAA